MRILARNQRNSQTVVVFSQTGRRGTGLDGKPRALHIEESLRSTDFDDFEPKLQQKGRSPLVECEYFRIEKLAIDAPKEVAPLGEFAIVTCLTGQVCCGDEKFGTGSFFLIPASLENRAIEPLAPGTTVLVTTIP